MKKEKFIFVCFFALSLVLFLAPWPVSPLQGRGLDKAVHAVVFACLAVSGFAAFPRKMTLIMLLLLLYGPVIEVLQNIFFAYRNFDLKDIAFDWIGVLGSLWTRKFFRQ